MALINSNSTWKHFIKNVPSDPDCIRTLADIEALEQLPQEERFLCHSPNEALATVARERGDDIALTYLANGTLADDVQQWTYTQYREEVVAAANLFYSLGLQPNQSVVFLLPNMPEMLFGLWGAQAAGIAAPINPFLQPDQIAGIAREADARILVTLAADEPNGDEFLQKALAAQKAAPGIEWIITVGQGGAGEHTNVINWAQATADQPRDRLVFERPLRGGEIASYFHTGGTTGTPKLAQHTHRAEVINVCQMMLTGQVQEEGREWVRGVILCALPLFHVNAVFVSGLTSIMGGGEIVLAGRQGFREKQLIKDFWGLVERHGVTFFAGVPTVYAALLEQNTEGYNLGSLSCCACGAAPMPVSLLREFRARTGADIMEGYGMTETTVCATSHVYHGDRKVGSIGMRIPYQQMRAVVLDGNGGVARDCDTNEIGVLLMRGPNVIPAYKQDFANKDAWPEPGWLNSGDMGRIDAEGYVWLTGRAKDLIIRGGHNIDPMITEDALTCHPDVEMAAAVGKPDAYAGELPVAYVQLRPGAKVTAEELKAFAREHAAERAGAPVEVIVCDELPKTAVGKTFKPDLRKDAIARAYRETAEQAWPTAQWHVTVSDDKSHGLKVRLLPQAPSVDLRGIRAAIATELDKLAFVWELAEEA